MQDGELIFYDSRGYSDVETNACVNDTSLFRIYSMTKIVTSVAALMLYEEGYFGLNDPIYDYIPEFKEMYVLSGKSEKQLKIMPAKRPITIKHLMTHTAGFTYSFNDSGGIIESMYKTADLDFNPNGVAFSEWVKALVKIPLLFHPGERWNYGVSTDILGYFIEIISGQSLSNFFSQRIFDPLNMNSTSFELNNDLQNRLVTLYKYKEPYQMDLIETAKSSIFAGPITRYQGGAGLISSGHDYLNFLEMLRSAGKHGNLRILKSKTIDLMTSNQLPGDLASMGQTSFGETNLCSRFQFFD